MLRHLRIFIVSYSVRIGQSNEREKLNQEKLGTGKIISIA